MYKTLKYHSAFFKPAETFGELRRGGQQELYINLKTSISLPNISWCGVIVLAGSQFNRHQHSHATSCRHFQVGPQAQIPVDFPMPHPGQSQAGMNPHLGPTHQPAAPLHPPLGHIPAPQFQDIQGPPFLPQALHQQYLIQQQILEAQHRRFLPQPRSDNGKSILWQILYIIWMS